MTSPLDDDSAADGAVHNASARGFGTPDASELAADALRLIGTAQEWARHTFADVATNEHAHSDARECTWCPLCQFVAVLRGERPEVTERVAEAGTALLAALRTALDAAAGAAASAAAGAAAGSSGAAGPFGGGAHRAARHEPPAPRVQRIDLGADSGVDPRETPE